jgi:hypothetical protein
MRNDEVGKNTRVEIDKVDVYQYLGYEREQYLRPRVLSLIESQIHEAYEFIKPAAYYTIKPITSVENSKIAVDGLLFTSHNLARVFSSCSQAAIFVVTIGKALEKKVAQLTKEGSILKASVLDAIGSVAVEKAADWLENMIRGIAAENGDKVGWRYSPGYCDWDITQQKELFRGLDGKSIGVNLTTTYLMVPRKSISGIMGMGKSCNTFSACRFCRRKNCPHRREEFA